MALFSEWGATLLAWNQEEAATLSKPPTAAFYTSLLVSSSLHCGHCLCMWSVMPCDATGFQPQAVTGVDPAATCRVVHGTVSRGWELAFCGWATRSCGREWSLIIIQHVHMGSDVSSLYLVVEKRRLVEGKGIWSSCSMLTFPRACFLWHVLPYVRLRCKKIAWQRSQAGVMRRRAGVSVPGVLAAHWVYP